MVSSDHQDLYVVDRYIDGARKTHNPYEKTDANVVAFKVYKLDEDWGWIKVQSLEDRVFIGEGLNFFVPVKEDSGYKGNCIYFKNKKGTWDDDEDNALTVFLFSTWCMGGLGGYYLSRTTLRCV